MPAKSGTFSRSQTSKAAPASRDRSLGTSRGATSRGELIWHRRSGCPQGLSSSVRAGPVIKQEAAWRLTANSFEMASHVALVDEADFRGDLRGGLAFQQQLGGAGNAQPDQIGVRRDAEITA